MTIGLALYLQDLQSKHFKVGARDTASREAIAQYIAKEKLRMVRLRQY